MDRLLVDLAQTRAAGVVERCAAHFIEHAAHHRGDADQLRGPRDPFTVSIDVIRWWHGEAFHHLGLHWLARSRWIAIVHRASVVGVTAP
jgi:hypothetical protein